MATQAHAHEVVSAGGFVTGLTHPVLGFDHLLAMISVGILSTQIGGKAIWSVPLTFVMVMIVGGVLGMQSIRVPLVEFGIALSVLALGVALAADRNLPVVVSMIFVGFFAVFHGHAHGTEMPLIASPFLYALGFVIGTAGIHVAGVLVGLIATRLPKGTKILRYSGAGIAGIGFHILVGASG